MAKNKNQNQDQTQVNDIQEPGVTELPELKDVVNGDLENAAVPKPAPVVEEPIIEVRDTTAISRAMSGQNIPGQLTPTKETTGQLIIRSIMAEYAVAMAPGKPVSEGEGANHQLKLYRAIEQVLRSPAELFHTHMNTFLDEVKKGRKTVFNEKYAFRFFHRVELPEAALKSFERLMNLFINTCDAASRNHALKQIDMEKTLEKISDESTRQRIFAFYHR